MPAQAEAPQKSIQRKERLEPQTKWGIYLKEPPLRCHRCGARLQGCNNLQKAESSRDHHAVASARCQANTRRKLYSFARHPYSVVQQTRSRVPRPHAAKSAKTDESAQEGLKATQRRKASGMKKLSGEGDALSRAIEGMQTAQAQQNQLMT